MFLQRNVSYNFGNINPEKWIRKGALLLEDRKENGLKKHKPHNRNKLSSHLLTNLPYDLQDLLRLQVNCPH